MVRRHARPGQGQHKPTLRFTLSYVLSFTSRCETTTPHSPNPNLWLGYPDGYTALLGRVSALVAIAHTP
eukprot:2875500-Prorocentrum_lima.AAC.1